MISLCFPDVLFSRSFSFSFSAAIFYFSLALFYFPPLSLFTSCCLSLCLLLLSSISFWAFQLATLYLYLHSSALSLFLFFPQPSPFFRLFSIGLLRSWRTGARPDLKKKNNGGCVGEGSAVAAAVQLLRHNSGAGSRACSILCNLSTAPQS